MLRPVPDPQLAGQIATDEPLSTGGCGGRPDIDAGCQDLQVITAHAWTAIRQANDPPTIFRRGGAAVRLEHGDEGEPIIRELNFNRMRHFMARAARWMQVARDQMMPVVPPRDVVNDVLACPDQRLPILTRIVEAPVFDGKGTLQTEPGYHLHNRTYFAPAAGFAVPDVPMHPTGSEVKTARELICCDLLGDFPFIGKAEMAHAVAALLLPFAREMIDGPTPLHLVEKPTPGTGATLLTDMLALPATGRPMPAMTEGRCEDEWRKRITAKLRRGSPYLLLDNLRRRLDGAAVSSAITSPTWEDRLLGVSQVVQIPVRCVWMATGNNPAVSSEIARRTVRIRLDAKVDQPWLRPAESFHHPDLRDWARVNRGRLVCAALTLIQGWIVAGRPMHSHTLGMFEAWTRVIGGILHVAGIEGFLDNLQNFYAHSDAESQAWRDFLAAWWDRFHDQETQVHDLWAIAMNDASLPLSGATEHSQRIVLGKMLAEKRDRVFDLEIGGTACRLMIEKAGTNRRATVWMLKAVNV